MFSRSIVVAALVFVGCAAPVADRGGEGETDSDGAAVSTVKTGYVTVRRDFRRCMFPLCGGYWVKAAETGGKLRCSDKLSALECYVPELDLKALKLTDEQTASFNAGAAVLYGATAPRTYMGQPFNVFVAEKAWVAPIEAATKGALYFASKNHAKSGREYQAVRLNFSGRRTFDAIDFGAAPGSDAQWAEATAAAGTDEGVILGGAITGPVSFKLFEADQFFLRYPGKTVASCTDALGAKITAVTDGLTWPSESDYPIDFVKGGTEVSDNTARTLGGADATAFTEKRDFEAWFAHVTTVYDTEDPIAVANAERFRTLKKTLTDNLTGLAVYRFGTINIRVVIIGKSSCGEVAGIATNVVET
jgi:hypothetical protein